MHLTHTAADGFEIWHSSAPTPSVSACAANTEPPRVDLLGTLGFQSFVTIISIFCVCHRGTLGLENGSLAGILDPGTVCFQRT